MPHATPPPDLYSLLQISREASPGDIKIAYHRTLLRLHPDKQPRLRRRHGPGVETTNATTDPPTVEASVDVALLKEAYRTLSDVRLRAAYDGTLRRREHARSHGPRPAQVVSLEEFATEAGNFEAELGTKVDVDVVQEWWHRCRCGGTYRITQDDLEDGTHLVGCESCSEVIWVGYEEAPITEDEDAE